MVAAVRRGVGELCEMIVAAAVLVLAVVPSGLLANSRPRALAPPTMLAAGPAGRRPAKKLAVRKPTPEVDKDKHLLFDEAEVTVRGGAGGHGMVLSLPRRGEGPKLKRTAPRGAWSHLAEGIRQSHVTGLLEVAQDTAGCRQCLEDRGLREHTGQEEVRH